MNKEAFKISNNGKLNIRDINIRDINQIVNNYTTNINVNERGLLKERNNGEKYKYELICIREYKNSKGRKDDGYIRVTCVNVHSNYKFITDHVHLDFPIDKWDEKYNYNAMKVIAVVYEYEKTNGCNGKSKDYGLKVEEVLKSSSKINSVFDNVFKLTKYDKFNEETFGTFKDYKKCVIDLLDETLVRTLDNQLAKLDSVLSTKDVFYSNFISNTIFTYYFLNHKLDFLVQQRHDLDYLCKDVIMDLLLISSKIMYEIDSGELYTWKDLFQLVNETCNVIQGVVANPKGMNKKHNKFDELNRNIKAFADKIDSCEPNKCFEKIRIRNKDFGYSYPTDVEKFNNELWKDLISYMICTNILTAPEDL